MEQLFDKYTSEDHEVWGILFDRQVENLATKSCTDYLFAIEKMKTVFNRTHIPCFKAVNNWFKTSTGWEIHCVEGLIPVDEFFQLLAEKKFPASTWLRTRDKLDYLEEPDMFHDVFGHIPLLCIENYSNFIHRFGKLGKKHIEDKEKLLLLQRLYWFTIEFGLIQENDALKVYGAGIISSFGETNAALEDPVKERFAFDVNEVLNTTFSTTEIQEKYFIISSFNELNSAIDYLEKKWSYEVNWIEENNVIFKAFEFKTQSQLAAFLVKVAKIADEEQHHPDAEIYQCSKLKLSLTTHDKNALTDLDWKLAKKIDALI